MYRLFSIVLAAMLWFQPAAANDNWIEVISSDNSVPEARHESAFATAGDTLVLLGGRGIKPVDIFDTRTKQWSKGAAPPIELHHFQAVNWNDELWAVGAFTGGYPNETPVPYVMIYSPREDKWRRGPDIPQDRLRGSAGAALVGDKIYIAGGAQDGHRGGHVSWLDQLDPKTGAWKRLADAPRARDHAALVAVDEKLYFVGGRLSMAPHNPFGAVVPQVDVYDTTSGTWDTLPDHLPNPRAGVAAVSYGEDIIVIGGESGVTDSAFGNVDALETESGNWRKVPSLNQPRHGTGAALYDDRIWIAAGSGARGGAPELSSMERYPN